MTPREALVQLREAAIYLDSAGHGLFAYKVREARVVLASHIARLESELKAVEDAQDASGDLAGCGETEA